MKDSKRIDVLDSFRFIAILSVILFHYYSRYAPAQNATSYYPYGDCCNFFKYGYLGVEFFFIISGFVIAYTLYGTKSIGEFWKKRMIRLFPPMVICSLITMVIFIVADSGNLIPSSHRLTNFIYSITFIRPELLNWLLKPAGISGNYINGSYWSLWPEIQFYAIASIFYYLKPGKFIRNFSIFAVLIFVVNWFLLHIKSSHLLHFAMNTNLTREYSFWSRKIFDVTQYILWFMSGILFYNIYTGNYSKKTVLVLAFVVLLQLFDGELWQVRLGILFMIAFFTLFIIAPQYLKWLNYKFISQIGLVSYTLYLIHENLGILLINKFASAFGPLDFLFPVLVFALLVIFSLLSYRYFEKPSGTFLKKKLITKR